MAVIFVFYTMTTSGSWTYEKVAKGWDWTGRGSTSPIGGPRLEYEREEQFDGPLLTRSSMKAILTKKFDELKEQGIIKKYKIRYSYKP